MATIQVRDIPEDVYEVIHRRARAAGQSLQSYMREQIVALADEPTDEELLEAGEKLIGRSGRRVELDDLLADLDAERR